MIYRDDCISIYFENLSFRKSIFLEFLNNLLLNHKFEVPFVNYTLSGDDNLVSILGYEIFDILYWFVPERHFELLYHLIMFFRLWCAGVTFTLFCVYQGNGINKSFFGSYIYCFCGYAVLATSIQPYFVSMFYYFPCILLGIEILLKKNKSLILSTFVCLSAICSINLFYYTTIAVGIYCFIRLYFSDRVVGKKITQILKIVKGYAIGVCLSAFMAFPIIISILSSSRIDSVVYRGSWITYGFEAFLDTFLTFFIWKDPCATSPWGYLGLSVLCIPAIIFLYMNRKKNMDLKIWFILILAFMHIPAFGYFAGISNVNNRWTFCLAFVVAYIAVRMMPQVISGISENGKKVINSVVILYCSIILLWAIKSKDHVMILETISVFGMMVVLNVIWKQKLKPVSSLFLLTLYGIFANLINAYSLESSWMLKGMVDKGGVQKEISNFVDSLYGELADEAFYRIDKARCYDELGCNLPHWYGYNGISSFSSMINPSVQNYYFESGNAGMLHSCKISDLDARATDTALASVKYYFTDKQNGVIPFGFIPIEPQSGSDKKIYTNPYPLPIGYSYARTIDYNTYCLLNPAEQQEIMLKAAVINDSEPLNRIPDLNSTEIGYTVQKTENLDKQERKWVPKKGSASLEIETNVPENCELYLVIDHIWNESRSCKINVQAGDFEDSFVSDSRYSDYGNKQTYLVLNLGCGLMGKTTVKVDINKGQGIILEGIHIFARNLDDYIQDIMELSENSMKNIILSINGIEGEISVTDGRFLCFSIPFSKGWKCYIDNNEVPLEKANIMYMGVPISNGEHHIELRYFPYGMKIGLYITCVTLFLVLRTKMNWLFIKHKEI